MHQSRNKKNKASLIRALASKNKETIKEALGIEKPIKTILFEYKEGKIFYERTFNTSESNEAVKEEEISILEKEEIIKAYEKDFNVWVINVNYSVQSNDMVEGKPLTFDIR